MSPFRHPRPPLEPSSHQSGRAILAGPPPAQPAAEPVYLAIALISLAALRPFICNWEELAHYFLRGVQADTQEDGAPETLTLNQLLALPDVPALSESPPAATTRAPVLPIHIERGDISAVHHDCHLAHDVTLQEVRIECFFPMDDLANQCFYAWARGG